MGKVRGVLKALWHGPWFRPALRYTLLFALTIAASPYLAVLWRIILYGDTSDQMLLIMLASGVWYVRKLWRLRKRKRTETDESRPADQEPSHDI